MGLLFIPEAICEHEELWWNDYDRGKLLICPPDMHWWCMHHWEDFILTNCVYTTAGLAIIDWKLGIG
jgi:hypothetical protein